MNDTIKLNWPLRPTDDWDTVVITSKVYDPYVFKRDQVEIEGDKIFLLTTEGRRYACASLERCVFMHQRPLDGIPELL